MRRSCQRGRRCSLESGKLFVVILHLEVRQLVDNHIFDPGLRHLCQFKVEDKVAFLLHAAPPWGAHLLHFPRHVFFTTFGCTHRNCLAEALLQFGNRTILSHCSIPIVPFHHYKCGYLCVLNYVPWK